MLFSSKICLWYEAPIDISCCSVMVTKSGIPETGLVAQLANYE